MNVWVGAKRKAVEGGQNCKCCSVKWPELQTSKRQNILDSNWPEMLITFLGGKWPELLISLFLTTPSHLPTSKREKEVIVKEKEEGAAN